jgi:RNA polymerase-binding transcription factor DksA
MTTKELDKFKQQLIAEKSRLEQDLSGVGKKNKEGNDWQATTTDLEVDSADENEVADKFEEFEGNSGIIKQLESQLNEVNAALARMEKGTYGICEVCGKEIEMDRLQANPSSRVSIKHSH